MNKEKRSRDFAKTARFSSSGLSAGNRPAPRHERRLIFDRATIDPIAVHLVWPGGFFNAARKFHRNVENVKNICNSIVTTIEVVFLKKFRLTIRCPFINTCDVNEQKLN